MLNGSVGSVISPELLVLNETWGREMLVTDVHTITRSRCDAMALWLPSY